MRGAILEDLELEMTHTLTAAMGAFESQKALVQVAFQQQQSAEADWKRRSEQLGVGNHSVDLMLDAQRRMSDSQVAYQRSLLNYIDARNVLERIDGSLLESRGVVLRSN